MEAAREYKKCFNERIRDSICERLAREQIVWNCNPPGALQFGGIWEKLVRSYVCRSRKSMTNVARVNDNNVFR